MHSTAIVGCAHIHTPGFIKRINQRDDATAKFVWDHDTERAEHSNGGHVSRRAESNMGGSRRELTVGISGSSQPFYLNTDPDRPVGARNNCEEGEPADRVVAS